MRLLKLASARPVSRIHALPQPFVPGTDPPVTPLEGTRAGLRAKRSQAASQLTEMSLLGFIASWHPLSLLELDCILGSATASQALLSHLGICRFTGSAVASRALSPPSAGSAISNALSGPSCCCLSGAIVPPALLLPLELYRLSGSIVLQAMLSPLGLYRPLGPIASRHLSGTIAPGLCCRLFGSIASVSGSIASWVLLSPLGLHRPSGSAIASRALSRIASRARLSPLRLCCLSGSAIALWGFILSGSALPLTESL